MSHKYSFDYDNTLIQYVYVYDDEGKIVDAKYDTPHMENIRLLRHLSVQGHKIYITTARTEGVRLEEHIDNSPSPEELIGTMKLPVEKVFYTDGACKVSTLIDNGIREHWDDCSEQCARIEEQAGNIIKANLVDAPTGIDCFLKNKFEKLNEASNKERG